MGVHTIYELRVLTKVGGYEFSSVQRFDELETNAAQQRYREEVARAHREVGTGGARPIEVTSQGGHTVSGRVTRMMVELVWRKQGDGWTSKPEPVKGPDGEALAVVLEGAETSREAG